MKVWPILLQLLNYIIIQGPKNPTTLIFGQPFWGPDIWKPVVLGKGFRDRVETFAQKALTETAFAKFDKLVLDPRVYVKPNKYITSLPQC